MTILNDALAIQPHLVELRREFHMHPEISTKETRTASRISSELESLGCFTITTGVNGNGILADLKSNKGGSFKALRADMDALQITEETGLEYSSQNPGVMHACGHDNHITMLLGAAHILAQHKDELNGDVRLIFQPAEELSPNGGAKGMIAEGALDGIDEVFGLHVWPDLPVGVFGTKSGPLMASSDHFKITIKGKSSHGAQPHEGVDAVVAGSQIVNALQTIVSRNANPLKNIVFTVGRLHAGTRYNIIAESCELEGTCRTFDADMRDLAEKRAKEIVAGVCAACGCEYEIDYERGYCFVDNTPEMVDKMLKTTKDMFGDEYCRIIDMPSMCAEDFAFYLQERPGCFAWLGTTPEGEQPWPLHNCHFAPSEDILWRGAALLASIALDA